MSSLPLTIAVDAMGGDHAPRREVEGAVLAAQELGIGITLVGPEELLREELGRISGGHLPIEIVHASEAVTMQESAARAVRSKRDSSIRAATRLVREGRAQGVVSAGNTGAVMATAKIVLGTLPSVSRPALAAIFPPLGGTRALLVDVGANVDCKPEQLLQFGVMGATLSRLLLNVSRPRVGLLSIGAEQIKGNELTREAYRLLEHSPLHFVGNVEGRDLYSGSVDVVVCDGFIGNVALKISEGLAEAVTRMLRQAFLEAAPAESALWHSRVEDLARRMDYSETGGAPLVGVRGVCTICHGSSSVRAIRSAIQLTAEFAAAGINEKMEAELHRLGSSAERKRRAATHTA
jgi:glycerol-3-phosphate acyltransferase PlsX